MNPRHPIYIVSKGRYAENLRLTSKSLEALRVPFFVVVEAQEYKQYCDAVGKANVLVLDRSYQDDYDTFDALGNEKSKGPGPARNFAWEHSIATGAKWHWVMDDNINGFWRGGYNAKILVGDGTIFRCMEDFVERYSNVAMAGPNYYMFFSRKSKNPPFTLNTRIYSCNLIRNDVPFRWRGRYNEDTDLSLRMLKGQWCTVLFNAFLQWKMTTQQLKGGNTAEFYAKEGTRAKSEMLKLMHPDVTRLVYRFGRHHHHVDYKPFRSTKLVLKDGVKVKRGVNNYGMSLVKLDNKKEAGAKASLSKVGSKT
jgi:hypothetical protein